MKTATKKTQHQIIEDFKKANHHSEKNKKYQRAQMLMQKYGRL